MTLRTLTSVLAPFALLSSPAMAQLSAGGGIAGYEIIDMATGDRVGELVVVDIDASSKLLPEGALPGSEYWRWDEKPRELDSFGLVPKDATIPDMIMVLPDSIMVIPEDTLAGTSWEGAWIESEQLHFDLEGVSTFPKGAGSSTSWDYAVRRGECEGCFGTKVDPSGFAAESSTPTAWFSFSEAGQEAWAVSDLGTELLELTGDEVLVFELSDLPAAGSVKVLTAD